MTQHTRHTTQDHDTQPTQVAIEHNTTLHDLYRKECARLFTPGTSTISTLHDLREA